MGDIHERLAQLLGEEFSPHLSEEPALYHDGLAAKLKNGTTLSVIYPLAGEYLFKWETAEGIFRIDTAPCHPGLGKGMSHLHEGDKAAQADRITDPAAPPEENLRRVMGHLLAQQG